MRIFLVILTIFLTAGCAKHSTFNIQNESNSTTAKVDSEEVDNNIEKYKQHLEDNLYLINLEIMKYEVNITQASSAGDILVNIENINKQLDKAISVINEYGNKSYNRKYQKYIVYLNCTYDVISLSYKHMKSYVNKHDKHSLKELNQLKDKMRSDVSLLFMEKMKKCEKIR